MQKAQDDEIQGQDRRAANKHEEVTVISSAHAVVKPYTVMILRFNTRVADFTVVAAGRSPDVASAAVLNRNFEVESSCCWWSNQGPCVLRWRGKSV